MTAIGGLGHTLPYLIPAFPAATVVAILVVASNLRHLLDPHPLHGYAVPAGGVPGGGRRCARVHCGHLDRQFMIPLLTEPMFTLAHLSDPHLAPLPRAALERADRQAGDRLHQLAEKTAFYPRPGCACGDCRRSQERKRRTTSPSPAISPISRWPAEFPRGRDWLESLGSAQDVTFVPGNHDIYVREAASSRRTPMGRVYERRRRRRRISLCPPPRQCRADRPFNRRADRALPGHRLARNEAARRTRGHAQQTQERRLVSRHTDPSPAGQLRQRVTSDCWMRPSSSA